MKIYNSIFEKTDHKRQGIISIGYFDAFHPGHKKILSELIRLAEQKKLTSYVLTYTALPSKEKNGKNILTISDRINYIKSLNPQNLIICHFEKDFYTLKPGEFINLLKENFNISEYVIGQDFAFGYKRSGHIETLTEYGMVVNSVNPVYLDNEKISTTLIKNLIKNGEVDRVRLYLERPHFITGRVIKGKQLGRQLGFPTMNIHNDEVLCPNNGVYITKTYIKNKGYDSMTFVESPLIETYLLNYHEFKYNIKIKIDFFKKIRDNRHFQNADLLIKQIKSDLSILKNYIKI